MSGKESIKIDKLHHNIFVLIMFFIPLFFLNKFFIILYYKQIFNFLKTKRKVEIHKIDHLQIMINMEGFVK